MKIKISDSKDNRRVQWYGQEVFRIPREFDEDKYDIEYNLNSWKEEKENVYLFYVNVYYKEEE